MRVAHAWKVFDVTLVGCRCDCFKDSSRNEEIDRYVARAVVFRSKLELEQQ